MSRQSDVLLSQLFVTPSVKKSFEETAQENAPDPRSDLHTISIQRNFTRNVKEMVSD
jgi:hypothetical protein